MPKRHRKSSDRDSTERLKRKIRKYQRKLENRENVDLEVRSPEKENRQLPQNEIDQHIDPGK